MRPLVQRCLLSISLLLMSGIVCGQSFPSKEGEQVRYSAYIELPKGYVSGICILQHTGAVVNGCLFNEFGITALSFTYDLKKQKIKLLDVLPMLDKWYIRKVVKKDLLYMMKALERGESTYRDERHHITYIFNSDLSRAIPEHSLH